MAVTRQRTVILYPSPRATHQQLVMRALAASMQRDGWLVRILSPEQYRPADLVVFWAHKREHMIQGQRARGLDYLVCERGYFRDRKAFTSLGFNGLNGRAQFHCDGAPADRWNKHGWSLPPWKDGGDCVVVMGQVPTDAAVARRVNFGRWVSETVPTARARFGLPVVFRPHPLAPGLRFAGVEHSARSLEEDLARAALAITFNSNTGVDAALAGVPVLAMDRGSMAWPVSGHAIEPPPKPDREQWANELAYCQWTIDEIARGEAWGHLRQRYEQQQSCAI